MEIDLVSSGYNLRYLESFPFPGQMYFRFRLCFRGLVLCGPCGSRPKFQNHLDNYRPTGGDRGKAACLPNGE